MEDTEEVNSEEQIDAADILETQNLDPPGIKPPPPLTGVDFAIVGSCLIILFFGPLFDKKGPPWAQFSVSTWAWVLLCFIIVVSKRAHRFELVVCVIIATMGELFLGFLWHLYEYRLGNLPMFIPPGHAIVFASGSRMSRYAPKWMPLVVVGVMGPYILWAAFWEQIDTVGAMWFSLFLAFLKWGPDPHLYATMFFFSLCIEVWGTYVADWWYFHYVPVLGLSSTNPPSCAGTFYCILDIFVLTVTRTGWAIYRKFFPTKEQ